VTQPAETKPTVFVCHGNDCSASKAWRKLNDDLDQYAHVSSVRCQKICSGPVCATLVSGQLVWFADVSGKTVRADLQHLTIDGTISKRLTKRIAKKRNNRIR
jgi:hypothetical protein